MTRRLSFLFVVLIAGCTSFPELDDATSPGARNAPYPELVPLGGLMAGIGDDRLDDRTGPALAARTARLRRLAARLDRIEAMTPTERAKLFAAIERHHQ